VRCPKWVTSAVQEQALENGAEMDAKDRTIKDVAKLAGVSLATVSFVLNGRKDQRISSETEERVMAAVRELDYRPRQHARALALGRSRGVALAINSDLDVFLNVFYSRMVKAVAEELERLGYQLQFSQLKDDYKKQGDLPDAIASHSVEGAVAIGRQKDQFVSDLVSLGIPLVLIDPTSYDYPVPLITINNRQGAEKAADHLIGLGHTNIGLVLGEGEVLVQGVEERNRYFIEVLSERGLRNDLWQKNELLFSGGVKGAQELMKDHPEVSAIIVTNDEMARGAIYGLGKIGLRVPEDVSVVGFDDIEESYTRLPELSTVHVQRYPMGQAGANKIVDLIEGREVEPRIDEFEVGFMERESSAPPRE